ncbi:ABC transporter substrate-binding protein [Halostella sp. JP-L12]|uniref:ABC transporter substrate-binding protein n=1 Tax=Halostella TaxID=1843185 RepID=UPI000EF7A764|nr:MULTISPECIES: ABC transporter substrate-binding protein [Halostella]NHN49140.1 ABC transporter substrate-binding protein [Halostella sp. JP-L12]
MGSDSTRSPEPTRREVLTYGSAVVGSGLLAGCSAGGDAESGGKTDDEPAYTASIAPVGEVEFESKPEDVFTVLSHHADMALALGRGDDLTGVYSPEYTDSLMSAFVDPLDGVSVDWADLYAAWNPDKETLYELDSDVHLADPANVLTMENWEQSDIEEVRDTVGPWFGNTFSDQHREPPSEYADDYEYYTLWEQFGRVADALRERNRYEALLEERDAMLSTVRENLPPENERPSVAMVLTSTTDESMWVYRVNAPGYHTSHTRPFGAVDAFGDDVGNGDQIDYEALVEADPDVLIVLGGTVDLRDMAAIRSGLEDDPVASVITAVQDGRVHAQGTRHQGPLVNLFQIEMTAKQLYPEQFGEWPTYDEGPYPSLPEEEQLFDHQRVANVIRGEF